MRLSGLVELANHPTSVYTFCTFNKVLYSNMVVTAISVNVEHTYIRRDGIRVFGSLLFWFLVSCSRFFLFTQFVIFNV